MKTCRKCGAIKSLSEFHKRKVCKDGLNVKCRGCCANDAKLYSKTPQRKKWVKKYYASGRYKKVLKKYQLSEKYRITQKRYRLSGKGQSASRLGGLKRKYSITLEDWNRQMQLQNERCAICAAFMKRPNVDHCHDTGRFRGLLCLKCNLGIGMFQHDLNKLVSAIQYLSQHPTRSQSVHDAYLKHK